MKNTITDTAKGMWNKAKEKEKSNYSNDAKYILFGLLLISHGILWWRGMWYESSWNERLGSLLGERVSSLNMWFGSLSVLFLVIVAALIDLAVTKDKENAVTCWLILGIEEGIILSVLGFLASIWVAGACCAVCTVALTVLLVVRIRKIKPAPGNARGYFTSDSGEKK